MARETKGSSGRGRLALIIGGGIVIVGLLAGLVTAVVLRNRNGDVMDHSNNPNLVEVTGSDPISGPVTGGAVVSSAGPAEEQGEGRLHVRLSKGQALPAGYEALSLVTGEPLTEDEIAHLLARLPELTTGA